MRGEGAVAMAGCEACRSASGEEGRVSPESARVLARLSSSDTPTASRAAKQAAAMGSRRIGLGGLGYIEAAMWLEPTLGTLGEDFEEG